MLTNRKPWEAMYAPDGAGGGAEAEAGNATDTEQTTTEEPKAQTFDELLASNKDFQAEFDRKIAKALKTQETKLEKSYADQLAAQKTEAEKLAKMNAEQKAQYEREKLSEELAEREANVTRRELRAEAISQLGEKKLPLSLVDVLDFSSAEACTNSIDTVEKAFTEAVALGVKEATRGGKPITKAPEGGTVFTREQMANMSTEEINANWDNIQNSLKT